MYFFFKVVTIYIIVGSLLLGQINVCIMINNTLSNVYLLFRLVNFFFISNAFCTCQLV